VEPASAVVTGYAPSCQCAAPDAPATVLDPFGGSGTTAMVALKHGRRAELCEINPEYIALAHERIRGGK
jgi:spermidine synthase